MKFRHGIQFRFTVSLFIFSVVVTLVFVFVMTLFQQSAAIDFYGLRLNSELQHFANQYRNNNSVLPPSTSDITPYLGTESLPQKVRPFISDLPDGVYFNDPDDLARKANLPSEWGHFEHPEISPFIIFGVTTLSDQKRLYLSLDIAFVEQYMDILELYAVLTLIVICVLGMGLAYLLARRVTAPLKKLARMVEASGPESLPSGFSQDFDKDEIGVLARALEHSLRRVKAFVDREHRFTRDASHELRTPITGVKGVLELLQMTLTPDNEKVQKMLERAENSVSDMEGTIESLLWLAREQIEDQATQSHEIVPLVENAMEQNRYLIAGKPVEMRLVAESEPVVALIPGAFSIAISNLIRNACQFTASGSIEVRIKEDRIEVADTGIGIQEKDLSKVTEPSYSGNESNGFGFGLDIVNRLCGRLGWELQIESQSDKGSTMSLVFEKNCDPIFSSKTIVS